MIALLKHGLLFVSCIILAGAIVSLTIGLAIRGLRKNSRTDSPRPVGAGRVPPAGDARGRLAAPSSRQGKHRAGSPSLVLLHGGGEDGPAAGDAAGPSNFPTP